MSDDRMTPPTEAATEAALDALLAQAASAPPAPLPDALAARLVAQAEAMLPPPAPGPAGPVAAGPARRGWPARLGDALADLGGAPGLAGLSVAGVAGVWIGFAQPDAMAGVPGLFWEGAATVSPTLASFVAESTPFDDFDALFDPVP